MPQRRIAVAIVGLFFFSALMWSLFVPVFESPDETTAYEYGRYYARTWTLPVLTQQPLPQGVHHWEPLYFFILGAVAKGLDAPVSTNSRYYYEDGWKRIREEQPMSFFRHEPAEFKFAWDDIAWSLHIMRMVSVLLSVGSVWLVYKIGREIFPEPSWIPIAAMALFAFNPQFVFFSGMLSVVNMATFSTSLFVWLLMRFMRRKINRSVDIMTLGASLGVAILSKMTALPVMGAAIVALWLKRMSEKKSVITAILLFFSIFMVAGGWYLLRNQALYGEFSGSRAHVLYRFGKITNPFLEEVGLLNYLISYPKTQWRTFWSGFGWTTIYLPAMFPFFMLLFYFHGLWGLVSSFVGKGHAGFSSGQIRQLIVLSLAPTLVWVGISRVIFIVEVFHGKDLFLVAGPLAILVVSGWKIFFRTFPEERLKLWGIGGVITFLVSFASVFWFRQIELARFFKGIADLVDVEKMFVVFVATAVILKLFWSIVSNRILREKVAVYYKRYQWQVFSVLPFILALANITILFGIAIPAFYQIPIWSLLLS